MVIVLLSEWRVDREGCRKWDISHRQQPTTTRTELCSPRKIHFAKANATWGPCTEHREKVQVGWRCKNSHNSKLAQKALHSSTGPAVVWGCIIVSKPSIPLQECPSKAVRHPPPPNGPGHHHFPGTIHLRPAINSLHFQAQAINPGTLN